MVGEDGQSRITDISEMTSSRQIYGKILQKFHVLVDMNGIDQVLDSWCLLLSTGNDDEGGLLDQWGNVAHLLPTQICFTSPRSISLIRETSFYQNANRYA